MLQKMKNNLQAVVKKWNSIDKAYRFIGIMTIIVLIFMFSASTHSADFLKEENYVAMEQVVSTIIEEKSTDVYFDTSKIESYEVTCNRDGSKKVHIVGKTLEEIHLTVDKDYQIKKLIRSGIENFVLVYLIYYVYVAIIAYGITKGIFFINRTIKEIVVFFKKK